jgi:polysaccharide pyruvyl transferase WcaK-like protein
MTQEYRQIGVVHHMDGGNLGEDASVLGIVECIKARRPEARIVGLPMVRQDNTRALEPPFSHRSVEDDSPSSHHRMTFKSKVKFFVINTPIIFKTLKALHTLATAPRAIAGELVFLFRSFRKVRSLDLVVISAGSQLAESTGKHRFFRYRSWLYPYTIYKWVTLARMAGAKVMVLNVTSDGLRGLGRRLLSSALTRAGSVSFCDSRSRDNVGLAHAKGSVTVLPDTAYTQNVSSGMTAHGDDSKPVVGLAPIVYGDPSPAHNDYLAKYAALSVWLTKNDYHVRLFCTHIGVDSPALCGMQAVVNASEPGLTLDRVHQWSAEELLNNMAPMDYVVTSRYHGVLLAHMLNKPVLAISDHESVRGLMNELGLGEYCVDPRERDCKVLSEKVLSLVAHGAEMRKEMAVRLEQRRQELTTQLDELFPQRVGSDAVTAMPKVAFSG